ncbi:MAG TPA: hypothetical protein VE178_19930, partial [Silvibacterium sp.]|nr:hypothetical protein [Silvibacterium sp.]
MLIQIQNALPESSPAVPLSPSYHRFDTGFGKHILLVNGSRVFSISEEIAAALDACSHEATESLLSSLGVSAPAFISDEPPTHHPLRS